MIDMLIRRSLSIVFTNSRSQIIFRERDKYHLGAYGRMILVFSRYFIYVENNLSLSLDPDLDALASISFELFGFLGGKVQLS